MKPTIALLGASLLFISLRAQAVDLTLHYCKDLTADQFRRAATTAFNQINYKIEQESANSVIGSEGPRKVEIALTEPGAFVVRWVPGFEDKNEKHVNRLRYEVLWTLATASKPGEVTINWCKDLTTERFHKAALGALHSRHYAIEKDTPSSLIGAQKKYKVEIAMGAPGHITVRWVSGYGHDKNNWLDNLSRDITWSLAAL